MSERVYTAVLPYWERKVKEAFARLAKSFPGGQREAGEIAGFDQQRISDFGLGGNPDMPSVRTIVALEDTAPRTEEWPHFTRALARHHGLELLDCGASGAPTDWHGALADAQRAFGDASSELVAALIDGTVSLDEARNGNLVAKLDKLLCPLVRLRGLVVAVEQEGRR